ncbi:hypothetical protein [Embleya hyalina]|uniref:Flavodoxin n=1 Tax=Embleya hyalina TaxID=516124 RepID=A0A401YMI7_9ACTN|nr:hypothetical protein [Embleya hyalina]GCD95830.1 hypothetical protein EHYA_03513 [Embleya hyalina]
MNVLIAYASAHGGTRAIAHRIAERLRGRGLHARVGPRAFRGRLFLRPVGGRYGDFRNRTEIEAWADGIAAELVPRTPTTGGTT